MKSSKKYCIVETTKAVILFVGITAVFLSCTNKSSQPSPSLPATVSFSKDIVPIFTANCLGSGCHSGSSAAGHLDLDSNLAYSQLFYKKDVDTTNPYQSLLYEQMNSAGTPMPPSGKLSDYNVAIVLKWIQQGAKNN